MLYVKTTVSPEENKLLDRTPGPAEVLKALKSANLSASQGLDRIPASLYLVHWDLLGPHLVTLVKAVFNGEQLLEEQRTSKMCFLKKPKKRGPLKEGSLRKVSLQMADVKLVTAVISFIKTIAELNMVIDTFEHSALWGSSVLMGGS